MKYIELFWNRLYYCIFNCDKKTQTLLNRFFDCLFYYLKFYRNRKGNNTRIPYNETVGICVSDYIMIGFTCLLIWTLFNLVSILFPCVSLLLEKPRDFDPFGHAGFAHLWLQYD